MSDKDTVLLTRIVLVIFIITSFIVANTDTPILELMSYSWGVISGSFLAPYVVMLYYKKTNHYGAWASMLTGFVIAVIPVICKLIQMGMKDATPEGVITVANQGTIYACAAMIASIIVCYAVSNLTSKARPELAHENDCFYAESC